MTNGNQNSGKEQITVIGRSSTCIGFGLCGIKDVHEVIPSTKVEELMNMVNEAASLILIDEEVHDKIKDEIKNQQIEKVMIIVPNRFKETVESSDFLEQIMKDTIGGNLLND